MWSLRSGYLKVANASSAPLVRYSDPLIEPAAKPLLPGEERLVMSMGMNPGLSNPGTRFFAEPVLTAGVFADDTTTGDPALLAGLVLRRSNMLLAVDTTLETLSEAGRRNIPRDQLIAEFKKMADSLHRWYLPPEQQVGLGLYQSMIGKLMNLPEVQYGSPFPPASFVAEETAVLRQPTRYPVWIATQSGGWSPDRKVARPLLQLSVTGAGASQKRLSVPICEASPPDEIGRPKRSRPSPAAW